MPTITVGDFEWDEEKNEANQRKHGVAFEEAIAVFASGNRFSSPYEHTTGEIRQYVVGFLREKEFTVVFTIRDAKTRIISARRSSKEERDELQG